MELGIHPEYLGRLVERGLLVKSGRGIYTYIDAELTEHHSLAVATQRVSHGTICLLSALQFHGIGTQAPFEVWMAIDVHARRPNSDSLPLHSIYMSGLALVRELNLTEYGCQRWVGILINAVVPDGTD